MIAILLPTLLLNLFSFFNLLGIKKELVFNELVFLGIALGFFFLAKKIKLHFFRENAKFFYWLFVALLIATYIIGAEIRGSRRWIDFYFFNFQPSEFFKIFFVIFFADFFSRLKKNLDNLSTFLKSLLYFLLPTFIIFKQPDLGNALVYVAIYLTILLFSEVPKRYILTLTLICVLILPAGWLFLHDYQKDRLTSFINPEANQRGTSYNMTQAIITTGSGKFLGKGLGFGTQSKLFFLPENHTDFAFSSLVEQFGFVGGFVVIVLYIYVFILFVKRALLYVKHTDEENLFSFYFIVGFFAFFMFQTLVNIGMNLGMFPIVGIALPFISYGGSSLVSLLFAFGLIP